MIPQEKILEEIDKLEKIRNQSLEVTKELAISNIKDIRSFIMHLTTISLLILAPTLPIAATNGQTIFKTTIFTFIGIFFLMISPIVGTYYLNKVLSKENNKLTAIRNFNEKTLKEAMDILYKGDYSGYLNSIIKFAGEEKELRKDDTKPQKDFSMEILTYVFVLGSIFIALSFFDWLNIVSLLLNYIK